MVQKLPDIQSFRGEYNGMPKIHTVTTYDQKDMQKLDQMAESEVVEILEHIRCGWLPQDYVYTVHDDREYTQREYDTARLHAAVRKAIKIIEESEEVKK